MLRALVRQRPSWPGAMRATARLSEAPFGMVRQPFHATARASAIGFKNFKNSPRLDWKTQQEMDCKDAKINAERTPYVSYAEALKAHRPRAWTGARKKIVWSRLFGGGNSSDGGHGGGGNN